MKKLNECMNYTIDQVHNKVGETMRLNNFFYGYSKSLTDEEMQLVKEVNEQYVAVFESETAQDLKRELHTLIEMIQMYIEYFTHPVAIKSLDEQIEELKNIYDANIVPEDHYLHHNLNEVKLRNIIRKVLNEMNLI